MRKLHEHLQEDGRNRMRIGRFLDDAGAWHWARLPLSSLIGRHFWLTGASGSGKSFLMLALLLQLLRERTPLVIVDFKGELTQLLLDIVIPAVVEQTGDDRLLERLRVVRPFGSYVPMLRLTAPEEGVHRDIQAWALASTLEDAYGSDSGGRMRLVFVNLNALAIELGEPLTAIERWLSNPAALAAAAQRSGDERLRRYALAEFPQEDKTTVRAVRARLLTLSSLPQMRAALAAPRCVSFAEALGGGVTPIDMGNPPAGAEAVARFCAGALVGRLTRAILSREVNEQTPQAVVVFEEFQEFGPDMEQFARLVALARYKRVGLMFINQQVAQLAQHDRTLPKLLFTNCGLLALFRSNVEDARVFAPMVPDVPGKPRTEVEREWTRSMAELPDRQFVLWSKVEPAGMARLRSPRLDLASLQARVDQLPAETRRRIQQGTVALASEDTQQTIPHEDPPRQIEAPRPATVRTRGRFPDLG